MPGRPSSDCAAGPVGQERIRRRSTLASRPLWTALAQHSREKIQPAGTYVRSHHPAATRVSWLSGVAMIKPRPSAFTAPA